MKRPKMTVRNADKTLCNIGEFIKTTDVVSRRAMIDAINEVLDSLFEQDYFGTEGQLDPRGDHRE